MVLPLLHELGTIATSACKLVVGDTEGAGKAWVDYSEQSVIGSGARAAYHGISGDTEEATRIVKGMGRAAGRAVSQAVTGGGLLKEVPVFKELDKAGKSLGDLVVGDTESANKRFTEELYNEYTSGSNWAKAGVGIAAAGLTLATGGLGYGLVAAAAVAAAKNAANQGIEIAAGEKENFDAGAVIASGLIGAANENDGTEEDSVLPEESFPEASVQDETENNIDDHPDEPDTGDNNDGKVKW